MKKTMVLQIGSVTLLVAFLLNGCGGGGGGNSPAATPVAVKFRTYSASTSPAPGIKSVGFRLLLPLGVSVATDPVNPKLVATDGLKLSGIFSQSPFKNYTSFVQGSYSSAKPTGTGRDAIRINFALQSKSFTIGEFLTINCSAAPGSVTAKGNFTLDEKILGGAGGVDETGQYKFDFAVQ